MDEVERNRLLDTLRQDGGFRAELRREILSAELLGVPQSVEVLVERATRNEREMAETRGDVTTLVDTTRQLLVITQNLATEMRQGFRAIDERFNTMDAQFIAMGARFDQIEAEIRALKQPPTS
ncbi:MAG TPA: hypothetical protein VND70_11030 [Acidimicrobiales bacterium]|nr:hypothetical protein [Acidimicrobiales bacterium]